MPHKSDSSYIPIASHEALLDRAADLILHDARCIIIEGPQGSGKTTLIAELARRLQAPRRVIVSISAVNDIAMTLANLARTLSPVELPNLPSTAAKFEQALLLRRLQRETAVLLFDDLATEPENALIEAINPTDRREASNLAVVFGRRARPGRASATEAPHLRNCPTLKLSPLTRTEARFLLQQKVAQQPGLLHYEPDAISCIHAIAKGIPARILRLHCSIQLRLASGPLGSISAELVRSVATSAA